MKFNPMKQPLKPLKRNKATLKKTQQLLILKLLKRKNCFCSKCWKNSRVELVRFLISKKRITLDNLSLTVLLMHLQLVIIKYKDLKEVVRKKIWKDLRKSKMMK